MISEDTLVEEEFQLSRVAIRRGLVGFGDNYTNGLKAWKEYFTNGLDACERAKNSGIDDGYLEVLVDPSQRRIIVTDAGIGMNIDRLHELKTKVLESDKIERVDERGEKGIGLLSVAYFDEGASVDIFSRMNGDKTFGHIRYARTREGMIPYRNKNKLTEAEMNQHHLGSFKHGTRVILNVPTAAMFKDNFQLADLRRFLKETYTPVLIDDRLPVYVGELGAEHELLAQPTFRGETLALRQYSYKAKCNVEINESTERVELDFPVRFNLVLDPEKQKGKVGVYVRGVNVNTNLIDIHPSLRLLPLWQCEQIHGYVDSLNTKLKLTMGREGFSTGTNAFKGLIDLLHEVNNEWWPVVEEKLGTARKSRINKDLEESLDRMRDVYQQAGKPINSIARGVGTRGPRGPANEDEDKDRKRKYGFTIIEEEFNMEGTEIERAAFGEALGRPVIRLNKLHPNFERYVTNGTPEERGSYYDDIQLSLVPVWEAADAEKKGRKLGDAETTGLVIAKRAMELRYTMKKIRELGSSGKAKTNGRKK